MGGPYSVQFQTTGPEDVEFIRELLSAIDVSDSATRVELTLESSDPFEISELLELKTDESGLDTLFENRGDRDSNGVQKTREASTEPASDQSHTDNEAETDSEDVASFQAGSSVPTILSAIDAHRNEWVDLDDVREALSDHPDINLDNLSGRLWSFADSGYLEKQKDGGRNQYRLTDTAKERLRAHAQ